MSPKTDLWGNQITALFFSAQNINPLFRGKLQRKRLRKLKKSCSFLRLQMGLLFISHMERTSMSWLNAWLTIWASVWITSSPPEQWEASLINFGLPVVKELLNKKNKYLVWDAGSYWGVYISSSKLRLETSRRRIGRSWRVSYKRTSSEMSSQGWRSSQASTKNRKSGQSKWAEHFL